MKTTVGSVGGTHGSRDALLAREGVFRHEQHRWQGRPLWPCSSMCNTSDQPAAFDGEAVLRTFQLTTSHYRILDCALKSFPSRAQSRSLTAMMKLSITPYQAGEVKKSKWNDARAPPIFLVSLKVSPTPRNRSSFPTLLHGRRI